MSISKLINDMTGNPYPALIFMSDAEHMELSFHVVANWMSKISNLLTLDSGLGRGDRVCVDLPLHWRSVVWHGGAWASGVSTGCDDNAMDAWVGADAASAERILDSGFAGEVWLQTLPSLMLSWNGPLPAGAEDASQAIMSCADALVHPDEQALIEDHPVDEVVSRRLEELEPDQRVVLRDVEPSVATAVALRAWRRGVSVAVVSGDMSGLGREYIDVCCHS